MFGTNFSTQGVRYTGSKDKLLPVIFSIVKTLNIKSICDGFSGSTRVAQCFARNKYHVIGNDISDMSYQFNTAFLLNKKSKKYYEPLINKLNECDSIEGWFTQNYSIETSKDKRPFFKKNMMKTDGIRNYIDQLEGIEKSIALVALMLGLNKIDNTMGHFSSYLRTNPDRSLNDLVLEVPNVWINHQDNLVYQDDIKNIIKSIDCDLVYYDPPYGSNQTTALSSRVRYASYYHFWKTLILNDKPELFGKANRRKDSRDLESYNPYEDYQKINGRWIAEIEIEDLIKNTPQKYILFSYSNEGRVPIDMLLNVFRKYRDVQIFINGHKRNAMASMRWINEAKKSQLEEYLFLLTN